MQQKKSGIHNSNLTYCLLLIASSFLGSIYSQVPFSLEDSLRKAKNEIQTGNFPTGMQVFHRLIRVEQLSSKDKAEIWHQIALNHYRAGQLDSVITPISIALEFRSNNSANPVDRSRSLFLRGAFYREKSLLIAAEKDLESAIANLEKHFATPGAAQRLPNMYLELGRIKKLQGEYEAALIFFQKARIAYKDQGQLNSYRAANIAQLEGTVLESQFQYEKAETKYQTALDSLATLSDIEDLQASVYNNYGLLATQRKHYLQAQRYFKRAISLYQKSYSERKYPFYLRELGNIYGNLAESKLGEGNFQSAVQLSTEGLALAQKGYDQVKHPIIAELYLRRGRAMALQGHPQEGMADIDSAINTLIPQLRTELTSVNLDDLVIMDRLTLLSVLSAKAEILTHINQPQRALKVYTLADHLVDLLRQNYLFQGSKYTLLKRSREMYEGAISLSHALCSESPSFCQKTYYYMAKNKASLLLQEIQSKEAQRYTSISNNLILQEEQLQQGVLQLEYQLAQLQVVEKERLQNQLSQAKESYFQFLNYLKSRHPKYFALKFEIKKPLSVHEIQPRLQPNELLIDYFVGEKFIFMAAITPQVFQILKTNSTPNFSQKCLTLRNMVNQQTSNLDYVELGYQLYQSLLYPILKDIATKRLTIIPDGPLNSIAFESLITKPQTEWLGSANNYLLKTYAVRYLYSNHFLDVPEATRRRGLIKKYAGFGLEYDEYTLKSLENHLSEKIDSTWFRRAVGKLYHSDDEVREVNNLLKGNIWINQDATKKAFLSHGENYRILHFAMHGIIDEEQPLNSALAFSRSEKERDFLLRAGDLYSIDLQAELAVLSACQTAYESPNHIGNGLRSFAQAFTYAGCKSLIASLWQASDKSSKDIIVSFFQELQTKLPKDIALQNAKLQYLENAPPAFSHPSFWANMVVIGNVRPIVSYTSWWRNLFIGILILGFSVLGLRRIIRSRGMPKHPSI